MIYTDFIWMMRNRLKLKKRHIEMLFTIPDRIEKYELEGLKGWFCLKFFARQNFYLIGEAYADEEDRAEGILIVYPEMLDIDLSSATPLEVYRNIANKYGAPVQIGGETRYYFDYTQVDSHVSFQEWQIIQASLPPNESWIAYISIKPERTNYYHKVHIALSFWLRIGPYLHDLKECRKSR